MTFEPLDEAPFPGACAWRVRPACRPRATAALIAADDVAVERFLDRQPAFPGMARLVEAAARFTIGQAPDLDELVALDAEVRAWAALPCLGVWS